MRRRYVGLLVTVLCALMVSCTSGTDVAGGTGHEGEAKTVAVAGTVYNQDSSPASGVSVSLRSARYLADWQGQPGFAGRVVVTDDLGQFLVDTVYPGEYTIEVDDSTANALLLGCDIQSTTEDDVVVTLPADTLRPYASLTGTVDTASLRGSQAYAQVYGLDRVVSVNALTGSFTMAVPQGTFTVRIVASTPDVAPEEVAGVVALSDSVVSVPQVTLSQAGGENLALWSYSSVVTINTSATGGNISQDITNFPLLVRLDAANFDFSRADSRGFDIRFAKPDGSGLRHEIEQWEPENQNAAIWVLVDTVFADDSSQSILMYYGRPNAPDFSSGRAVFDTALGYTGVWHLGEEHMGVAGSGLSHDATPNAFHGINNVTARDEDGIAGRGKLLDPQLGDFVDLGANRPFLSGAPAITLEAWCNTNAITAQSILSFTTRIPSGAEYFRAEVRVGGAYHHFKAIFNPSSDSTYPFVRVGTTDTIATGVWYHVAAIADLAVDSMYLFVNGTLLGSSSFPFTPTTVEATNAVSADIGARLHGGTAFFDGLIDEARAHHVRRSAAWIKLGYENQRPDSRLVEVE